VGPVLLRVIMLCRNLWKIGLCVTASYHFIQKVFHWKRLFCTQNYADLSSSMTCTCNINYRTGFYYVDSDVLLVFNTDDVAVSSLADKELQFFNHLLVMVAVMKRWYI